MDPLLDWAVEALAPRSLSEGKRLAQAKGGITARILTVQQTHAQMVRLLVLALAERAAQWSGTHPFSQKRVAYPFSFRGLVIADRQRQIEHKA
jgi:hypothetical protein